MKTPELLALPHEEINAIVHIEIMGRKKTNRTRITWDDMKEFSKKATISTDELPPQQLLYDDGKPCPNYATSMDLCMGLVEEHMGWGVEITKHADSRWMCEFFNDVYRGGLITGIADTPQLAIIVAALKAKGFIKED